MFDYSKLVGRIIEMYGTRGRFATAAKCSKTYISQVLNGHRLLRQTQIRRWCDLLEIQKEDIGSYFFTLKVNEIEHNAEA